MCCVAGREWCVQWGKVCIGAKSCDEVYSGEEEAVCSVCVERTGELGSVHAVGRCKAPCTQTLIPRFSCFRESDTAVSQLLLHASPNKIELNFHTHSQTYCSSCCE